MLKSLVEAISGDDRLPDRAKREALENIEVLVSAAVQPAGRRAIGPVRAVLTATGALLAAGSTRVRGRHLLPQRHGNSSTQPPRHLGNALDRDRERVSASTHSEPALSLHGVGLMRGSSTPVRLARCNLSGPDTSQPQPNSSQYSTPPLAIEVIEVRAPPRLFACPSRGDLLWRPLGSPHNFTPVDEVVRLTSLLPVANRGAERWSGRRFFDRPLGGAERSPYLRTASARA
jgi:hypothetical protein